MMPMSDTLVISPSSRAPRLETPSVSYIAGSGSTVASPQIYIPAKTEQKGTVEDLEELRREYPEVVSLATKLASGMQLYKSDILILREVAEAMGWDEDDAAEELKNLATNPSKRVEKYMELFQKYYSEAHRLLEQGDYPQAAEKLWGAATALIKLHAALRGVFIAAWSHGKLYNYVTHNVETSLPRQAGEVMHRYFYDDPATFKDRWEDAVRHMEKKTSYSSIKRSPDIISAACLQLGQRPPHRLSMQRGVPSHAPPHADFGVLFGRGLVYPSPLLPPIHVVDD